MAKKHRADKPETVEYSAAFAQHGVEFSGGRSGSKDRKGRCPFCMTLYLENIKNNLSSKEAPSKSPGDTFSLELATSKWHCFLCGRGGNLTTFLTQLHQFHLERTTIGYWKSLAVERQLPWSLFQYMEVAYDSLSKVWMIPVFSRAPGTSAKTVPTLSQLRTWSPTQPLYNTAGLPSALFNLNRMSSKGPIFLCEGEWDAMALTHLFHANKLFAPNDPENAGIPNESPTPSKPDHGVRRATPSRTAGKPSVPRLPARPGFSAGFSITALGIPSILSVPGANTFKPQWCDYFSRRPVFLLFDNDEAGRTGMARTASMLNDVQASPSAIVPIKWPEHYPDGFDLRDFIVRHIKQPKTAWHQLQIYLGLVEATNARSYASNTAAPRLTPLAQSLASPGLPGFHSSLTTYLSKSDPARTETFNALIKRYKKEIYLTPYITTAIAASVSVILSIRQGGDPLWMFLIGPPGCGKSMILQSFAEAEEFCDYQSKFKASSLVSGWGGASDPASLLRKIAHKCLIIKDYTAVKSMPASAQEELYGILRDAYDGKVSVPFGNGQCRNYSDCHFSMLAGVTDVIHADQRAALGERFLKCELVGPDYDPTEQIRAAISDSAEDKTLSKEVRDSALYYLRYLAQTDDSGNLPSITVPQWVRDRILALAHLAGILRAAYIPPSAQNPFAYRPRPEVGTRLAKQLVKLGRFLALVLNRKSIDKEVYSILERIAFDTAHGWNLEILTLLINCREITSPDLIARLNISHKYFDSLMSHLLALNVVETSLGYGGQAGRAQNVRMWRAKPHISTLWKEACLTRKPFKEPKTRYKKRG